MKRWLPVLTVLLCGLVLTVWLSNVKLARLGCTGDLGLAKDPATAKLLYGSYKAVTDADCAKAWRESNRELGIRCKRRARSAWTRRCITTPCRPPAALVGS